MTKRLICLAAAATAIAGCAASGGTAPQVLPPASQASQQSARAGGNATTASSPGGEAAAVEAAVRHYFAAENVALATGAVQQLLVMTTAGCSCRALAAQIQKDWSAGTVTGAAVRLTRLRVHDELPSDAGAEVWGQISPYKRTLRSGEIVEDSAGGPIHDDLTLAKSNAGWIVTQVVNLG